MLKRLIPVLLLDRSLRLVKTEGFSKRTYVGDPFNVVRLFNEMQVDEICLLDVDATSAGVEPNYDFLGEFASECFMPMAYGGGISHHSQVEKLNKLGVEKFVLGTQALNTDLVNRLVASFGSQALVGCIDYVSTNVVSPRSQLDVKSCAHRMQALGFGEIILQSIESDGMRKGYDLDVVETISSELDIPVIALGGAKDYQDLGKALRSGASAAATGSAFTFVGDLRAVLINYPTEDERLMISSVAV